jgi:poly-gamma-glutamate synthesis protein (capsule biosynthesis protein)
MEKEVKEAKSQADLVIVSFHYGEEYYSEPTDFQISISRTAIDAGADLVIGHHPHVVQKIEKYKSGYIAYSLGNFIFDQGFSEKTMEGPLLKVIIKGDKIKEVIPIEIKINKFFQPELKK